MADSVVLHIGIPVNDNGSDVSSENNPIPDAGALLNGDVANQNGGVSDKSSLSDNWYLSIKCAHDSRHC
jgi:hypothetical protein